MTNVVSKMLEQAREVMGRAYAPYSHFHVGCCIRTPSGRLFAGANVENASYSLCLCAESSAISAMIAAGEKEIAEVVIIGGSEAPCSPCGACRQRLSELAVSMDIPVHTFNRNAEQTKTAFLGELLPGVFSQTHLLQGKKS